MKTNLIVVAALSVLPAFSASAQNGSVLDHVREQADLFSYQLNATQEYCADLAQNVLPALNALELSENFSATFDRSEVECDIQYGDEVIERLSGQSLFSIGRGFDNQRIAKSIIDQLNTDERLLVVEHLQLPSM